MIFVVRLSTLAFLTNRFVEIAKGKTSKNKPISSQTFSLSLEFFTKTSAGSLRPIVRHKIIAYNQEEIKTEKIIENKPKPMYNRKMDNRLMQRRRKKRRRRRLSRRFIGLLLMLGLVITGIYMYMGGGLAADYPEIQQQIEVIDISLMQRDFDDFALTYRFYYADAPLETDRHHIIDDDGIVNEIIFNPSDNSISISTDIPAVFFVEYSHTSGNVYITAANPKELYDRIVIIDAGHGGADPGAIVGDVWESHIVLAISHYVYALFAESSSGIKAYMTRHDDSFVSDTHRSHIANTIGDMFISIHTNTFRDDTTVAGTEMLFNSNSPMDIYGNLGRFDIANAALAQIMQNHVVAELGTRDRGIIERSDLYILNTSAIPTIFVEIDFKTNPAALANLLDSTYRQRVASAIYQGIVEAFSLASGN